MQIDDSEAISAVDYRDRNRELIVRFTSGGLYAYAGVERPLYDDFLAAESKGRFFHERVLDRFPYRRLA